MTNVDEFNHEECCKTDANCINAYTDFHLDPENPAGLCLETSWGGDCLDLTSIVKAAETVTTLHLSPAENPNCLEFEREDGQSDCIHGDDLSRIISMTKLKDVDQETAPTNGDVYMYNNGKWYTFNLQDFVTNTNTTLGNLQAAITQIQNQIAPIINRWQLPNQVPDDAKIMLGNINLYSDTGAVINSSGAATSLDKSHGIYGHDLNTDKAQDEIFG
jgi:hypothetical protein